MAKLVIMRHGQSEWNAKNLFNGWIDTNLSETGVEQAQHAGQQLKATGIAFDYAYTSLLKRAIKTLHILLEETDQLFVPESKIWRLNERHYGALQGMNRDVAREKWGAEQVHIWRRAYDVLPPQTDALPAQVEVDGEIYPAMDRRYADLAENQLPHGESLALALARIQPYWEQAIVPKLQTGQNVLIVAHGSTIRALTKIIEGISDADIMHVEIANAEPISYDLDQQLKIVNKQAF
ncbi:2,3-bisphosphoglycerate-dependent phosphoglycerate mutase [Weissella uvarum]|uniref:2,3-bisphosphoglycerate-dependent phosphoglycerate mutase n=1 Tax=Weissella uvarum TaxID=1479233 RepID=UPI001961F99A|nr:2,3-bisphosphoglycerate-dependent phosphoglycerate mutase [Weissella uvarum]MBM7617200.1 2,3-bisphosphoglycerate-dependent phosphoglycerate mutase [Weissella uvarum]MCM0595493.1 2,3-bisphosphoglycerate-dependent phosphoglycerate mutase [Weissella uvarum]